MHRSSSVVIGDLPDINGLIIVQVSPRPGDVPSAPGVDDRPRIVSGPPVRLVVYNLWIRIEAFVLSEIGGFGVVYR